MLCLANFSGFAWFGPLIVQKGPWLTRDFELIALGVVGLLGLLIFCSIAAAGMALLCSFVVLLRGLFGALTSRWSLQEQFMPEPLAQRQAHSQADVNLLPLGVKEGKWVK